MVNWQEIKEKVNQNPLLLEGILIDLDQSNESINEQKMDDILGLSEKKVEEDIKRQKLGQKYGNEQFKYEGTPYNYIRRFLRVLNPKADDVVYDLGSGYGRVVFYGALVTQSQFKGIEIIPERSQEAQRIKSNFQIQRAQFVQGNVLDQDYSDGTIFFLFNPFSNSTLDQVINRLKEIAKSKQIKIISWGGPSTTRLLAQDWLKEISLKRDRITSGSLGLKIFISE